MNKDKLVNAVMFVFMAVAIAVIFAVQWQPQHLTNPLTSYSGYGAKLSPGPCLVCEGGARGEWKP